MIFDRYIGKEGFDRLGEKLKSRILNTTEEINANTKEDMYAGALALKEVNNNLKSLGNVQNIEFPYVPSEDGFIQYLCGVLQNNVSYLQFKENGEVYYQNGSLNAMTYSGMFFVKSGNTYTLTSSNANIKKMVFCPLH